MTAPLARDAVHRRLDGARCVDATAVEFDLAGIVGLRVLGATLADLRDIEGQVGPHRARLRGRPDIEVRFVDHLGLGPLHHVGIGEAGFDRDWFVLRGPGGNAGAAAISIESERPQLRIVVERGAAVPHLLSLVNVATAARGHVAVPGSAFVHRGRGVLVVGWSGAGKTEALIAFMRHGATFVADGWVYVDPRHRTMTGLHAPIPCAPAVSASRRTSPTPASSRAALSPLVLFGPAACAETASIDTVVLLVRSEREEPSIQHTDGREVAMRLRYALRAERAPLLAAYHQFRFAFPGEDGFVERACRDEDELLFRALTGVPACLLVHPSTHDPTAVAAALRAAWAAT